MKILKAETTALRAFLQFNSWSEARNHGLPDHDGKAVNSLLGFARQIPVCRDDAMVNNIGKISFSPGQVWSAIEIRTFLEVTY